MKMKMNKRNMIDRDLRKGCIDVIKEGEAIISAEIYNTSLKML